MFPGIILELILCYLFFVYRVYIIEERYSRILSESLNFSTQKLNKHFLLFLFFFLNYYKHRREEQGVELFLRIFSITFNRSMRIVRCVSYPTQVQIRADESHISNSRYAKYNQWPALAVHIAGIELFGSCFSKNVSAINSLGGQKERRQETLTSLLSWPITGHLTKLRYTINNDRKACELSS